MQYWRSPQRLRLRSAGAGTLLSLGDNGEGQLGYTGEDSAIALPVQLEGEAAGAAQGGGFSLAFTRAGKLYGFGSDKQDQLGETCVNGEEEPCAIAIEGGEDVVQVAAGSDFSLAVTSAGKLYSFGASEHGQLGRETNLTTKRAGTPSPVALPSEAGTAVQVAAGKNFALVLTSTGKVYGFGSNEKDQLARKSSEVSEEPEPVEIKLEETATEVAAGETTGYVLTEKHNVFAFGNNNENQAGRSTEEGLTIPTATEPNFEPGVKENVAQLAAGGDFLLARTSAGRVFSLGGDEGGQLGRKLPLAPESEEEEEASETGAGVELPKEVSVTDIAAGNGFAIAVDATGRVWGWGEDEDEQLGHEPTPGRNREPKEVAVPKGDVIDAAGEGPMGSQTLLITGSGANQLTEPLEVEPPSGSFTTARVGRSFSAQLYATGGVKPYTWSAQGLPRGLSIGTTSGAVSGAPQSAGAFSVAVSVTDADGHHASRTVRLDVEREQPPAFAELKESARVWRESTRLPRIARAKPPVGTEFFFELSAPAHVTLTFCRVRGRRCKREGTLSFERRQGFASVHFYGRLTRRHKLPRGRYKVSFKASNAAGSRAGGVLSFEIVR